MADEIDPRCDTAPLEPPIAGTGPGIPDDALAPGEDLPTPPSEEEAAKIARTLGVPAPSNEIPK